MYKFDKNVEQKVMNKRMLEESRVMCYYSIDPEFMYHKYLIKNIDNGLRVTSARDNLSITSTTSSQPDHRKIHEKHKIYKSAPRVRGFSTTIVPATKYLAGCYIHEAEKIAYLEPHRCDHKCEMDYIQPTPYKHNIHRKPSAGRCQGAPGADMELPLVSFGLTEFPKSQIQVWER